MNKIFTFLIVTLISVFASVVNVEAQNGCDSWIPRDGTFNYVPFTDGVGPYERNDDGSTDSIVLPFKFCFWNQEYTSVYINNNGNISFGTPYASFSPDSFPNKLYSMIAPFWGDVDTRNVSRPGSNVVIYKIQPHYMIVQWDSVAYYTPSFNETDSLSSFQLIITDGTDPIIPRGNNVSFTYRSMHWTTGDASLGINGYGGYAGGVGANEGDSVRFIQIGRFDNPGASYLGQFPNPPYDGVAWLDYKTFYFNLCAGRVPPLVSGISPCDTFKICLGDTLIVPFLYFSPAPGDSVYSKFALPIPPGVSMYLNHPGPTDSLDIKIIGSLSNLGDHVVNIYGYDNETPPDTTYTSFVVEVDIPPVIHASANRDSICIGDTAVLNASGGNVYTWSNGKTTSSINVTPATTQIYTVSISNGGCIKDTTLKVTVLPIPVPAIKAVPDSVCPGDTVLLTGSGGKDYFWSNGKRTSSIKVTPFVTTTYTMVASNGICGDSTTKTINVLPKTTATISAVNDTVCPFAPTTITAKGTGGQVSYKWNTGATTSSITVHDSITTTYTATVYGICDSVQQFMTVNIVPLPKPVIEGSTWKCKGKRDSLAVISATNPTTYLWSNGATTSSITTGTINADSTVYVTAYNRLGCSVKDTLHITERAYPTANITYPPGCGSSETTITAIANGVDTLTYRWNTGGTNDTIDVYINQDTTIYTLVVSNGCPITKTITVIRDIPELSACCNTVIFTGKDTTIYASGPNIVSYKWLPETGLNCDTCAYVTATPLVTTTYTVIGTDAAGCPSERTITIVVDVPCFNLTVPNVFTPNNSGALGLDNVFYIKTENINAWSLTVFDRWGRQVYYSTNPNQYWDGNTMGGGKAPDGVYYYIIDATCQNNTYKKDGFVQLIR